MNRSELAEALRRIVSPQAVVDDATALMTYEADACVMDLHAPSLVVLPTTTEQVAAVVQLAQQAKVPIVPRGAGTGDRPRSADPHVRRAVRRAGPHRHGRVGAPYPPAQRRPRHH